MGKTNVQCYNCNGKGHYARDCSKPRVRAAKYFKEQMLLAAKVEAGVNLDAEENDFMLMNAYSDDQLEELNASAIMMAHIQPTDDKSDAEPTYDAEVIIEDNSGQVEHDLNDHDQYYADIKSLIYNVQVEAENQHRMNNELKKQNALIQRELEMLASSSSVSRLDSKDNNSKKRVLLHIKSKSNYKDFKKSQSSVSLGSNKHNTFNSNVSESKANVLNAKTINVVNDGLNLACVSCGKDVFMISHDKCIARYALSMNSRVKRALFTSIVVAKSSKLGATLVVAKSRFSVAKTPKATNKVIQLVLWIIDSGCSKQMTGNLKLLKNFIEKFMGTVCFGNDHFASITSYGDYVQGNLTICHGEDLLTGFCDSSLYTISISEMAASSPVCLMSKATSTKSWLWHRRISHLNFSIINHLTKHDLVDGISKFKYNKDHLCLACEQGKSKKAILKPKLVPSIHSKLELIHMDLYGPIRVESINGKRYICSEPSLNRLNFQDSSEDLNETPSKEDLDNLFGPLYEEYYETRSPEVSTNSTANTLNNEDTPSSSSIIVEENEAPQIVSSLEEPIANEPTTLVSDDNADESV
ncbi:integrase, catalytic region, zinc finger, CCHC-type containing protein [Tanacetum coccineum]